MDATAKPSFSYLGMTLGGTSPPRDDAGGTSPPRYEVEEMISPRDDVGGTSPPRVDEPASGWRLGQRSVGMDPVTKHAVGGAV